MTRPLVYLAGPIDGMIGLDATDWRDTASGKLWSHGIEALSPMRGKQPLAGPKRISSNFHDYEHLGAFFTAPGIMARDFNDVKRADVLLVNFLGAEKRSFGTVMEIAWAYAFQKPVVVAMEREGSPYDLHPMLSQAMPFRLETLEDALDAVILILNR